MDWYKASGLDVYFNPYAKTCNGSLHFLAYEYKVEKFLKAVTEEEYVFNDSDVVPIDECPNDFIEELSETRKQFSKHKVGLGLKIDDIPDHFYKKAFVHEIEGPYWSKPFFGKLPLYEAPIDTTLAVYAPGSAAAWGSGDVCLRTGYPYVARHLPWYYDYNNLPEDEKYYILHLEANQGPTWAWRAKEIVK